MALMIISVADFVSGLIISLFLRHNLADKELK